MKNAADKRAILPRETSYAKDFLRDWEKLERSGKHDMNVVKECMMLLIANDAPLSAEWKDHQLKGELRDMRECHIKGDLVLVYHTEKTARHELIMFFRIGTHSEIF
ncbi:MAG: type II toxin-antitoxin system YafQ family toxin [Synergistaceae bacterium]|nr:type II toxin-antitoxin system YafQ family toxin [Synergistaceae bacterium]MBQ3398403.1 type II toxin-antitoxin system YafQ family toxin [Synergistaceae bacterium]MBQ3759716.1 type II toxin-antitoxin system YafQ family toxin [Synergistaceae bacterium]MBQ6114370.1 type II toxin-antitoxin system YafQ family toxin [Synergistaceae bacterium]MBQ6664554.1 type II toxin-antitoxin system YafQ family toxin [Synergistaceae bacterium]